MAIDRLKPQRVRAVKSDILYRLDNSGKSDREKLDVIEDIREILLQWVSEKSWREDSKKAD